MSSSPSDLLFSRAAGTFKLIQLPTELSSVVQDSLDKDLDPPALVFKGDPSEDAVLCTHDKTYAVRSVVLSNTMLVVTSPTSLDEEGLGEHERVVIRDQLHDILELNPIVPRLDKIWDVLSGTEYDENDEDDDNDDELSVTYDIAFSRVQSSRVEFDQALAKRHILNVRGYLRPISQEYLTSILSLILNHLTTLSFNPSKDASVSMAPLLQALSLHDVSNHVTVQILRWFGEILETTGQWIINVPAVVKQVGIGVLRKVEGDPPIIEQSTFLRDWTEAIGDAFESFVDLSLVAGNYFSVLDSYTNTVQLRPLLATSLPSSAAPAPLFATLFAANTRWKPDELTPYLTDITGGDNKERDKLLLKFCRVVRGGPDEWGGESQTWYCAKSGNK